MQNGSYSLIIRLCQKPNVSIECKVQLRPNCFSLLRTKTFTYFAIVLKSLLGVPQCEAMCGFQGDTCRLLPALLPCECQTEVDLGSIILKG
jgi:hypothetical protein